MRFQYSSLSSDRPAFSRMRKLIHFVYITFLALLLFSCADHSNVVDPSTDSTIEDWFNVAVPSSVAVSNSSTAIVTSSDAVSSSETSNTSTSSDDVSSSITINASSITLNSSSTIPIVSSSVTVAVSSSTIPIVSSSVVVALSSSIKPSSSSVPVSSSATPSSSSGISPNTQTCPYSASGSAGTLTCSEKIYATIVIGTQTWMAENLNFTPSSGTSWCYNNVTANCEIYGRLYNWETAKKACPNGWHLPTDSEWKTMEKSLGMDQVQADSLYNRGTIGDMLKDSSSLWTTNTGTNSSGFSALPGGDCNVSWSAGLGLSAYFWAAADDGGNTPWFRGLFHEDASVNRAASSANLGHSVRCLKDAI